MGVEGDLIWGDDDESEVFAQAQNHNICIIFRYSLHAKLPRSLPSRIVNCFHCLPVNDTAETFSDREKMREALWASIRRVWDQCVCHSSITAPDVTVEIYEDTEKHNHWRISHESLYERYMESLLPIGSFFQAGVAQLQSYDLMDYSNLVQIGHLGGRGRTAIVRCASRPHSSYVFKGVDFGSFLESRADFELRKEVCYHEIRTLCSLPSHPNIMPSPKILVTARKTEGDPRVYICGTLYPFMEHGTLDDQVQNSNAAATPLSLIDKARWCLQMASAVAHTHDMAHTFHMDIKPANFLVNDRRDLILIDWEQSGAWKYSLAPEADGSWDVEYARNELSNCTGADSSALKLIYEKYCGPDRENLAWEAAEVFSLGRTMWMLMEQIPQSRLEEEDNIVIAWGENAQNIPPDWKAIVVRCLDPDPNERVQLSELVEFWEAVKRNGWTSFDQSEQI